MLTIHKPLAMKRGPDAAYVFRIDTDTPLTSFAETLVAACAETPAYVHGILTEFLRTSAGYFKTPLTVPSILRLLQHEVKDSTAVPPYRWTPTELVVCKNVFYLGWTVSGELLQLDISANDDEDHRTTVDLLPSNRSSVERLPSNRTLVEPILGNSSLDSDSIPFAPTNEVIHLQGQQRNSRTELDRSRVKEAHLRAKLAVYKANRAHLEYVDKYGEEPDDSSEEELEDSDEESS